MKTIIIGDVHGCFGQLNMLLKRLSPDPESDTLVFLGDLFDRGSDSWEVFQKVMELADSFGSRFILLRGNHEDYLLRPRMSMMENLVWKRVGKQSTVDSFRRHGMKMKDAVPWIRDHVSLFYRSEKFQCVHAGVMVEPIEANSLNTLIHDHSIATENCYDGFLTIIGHIALSQPVWFAGDRRTFKWLEYGEKQTLPERGVICIDTGCGKDGMLTAMVVEGDQFTLVRPW